jgi:hypothetical protein
MHCSSVTACGAHHGSEWRESPAGTAAFSACRAPRATISRSAIGWAAHCVGLERFVVATTNRCRHGAKAEGPAPAGLFSAFGTAVSSLLLKLSPGTRPGLFLPDPAAAIIATCPSPSAGTSRSRPDEGLGIDGRRCSAAARWQELSRYGQLNGQDRGVKCFRSRHVHPLQLPLVSKHGKP